MKNRNRDGTANNTAILQLVYIQSTVSVTDVMSLTSIKLYSNILHDYFPVFCNALWIAKQQFQSIR